MPGLGFQTFISPATELLTTTECGGVPAAIVIVIFVANSYIYK